MALRLSQNEQDPFPQLTNMSLIMEMRRHYTPDLTDLNRMDKHYVFIPSYIGHVLGGFPSVIRGKSNRFLGGAISLSGNFQKRTSELGANLEQYATSAGVNDGFSGHLQGFCVAVPTSEVCNLDMKYNHGHQTSRHRRTFYLTADKNNTMIEAFVWLYKRDYLQKVGATRVIERANLYNEKIEPLRGRNILV